ncbi:MAG: nucleotidyltransferase family protein [Planctomycetaceae bacterium]|nr:nucleotidyltransferase family protein [Planctomycetaceae bacterium]
MSTSIRRLFALIPAAGHSRRMGQPKLLLPFGDTTVIGRLIQVLRSADIETAFVLVRFEDESLADEVRRCGASVVQPSEAPPEMRVSVEVLLDAINQRHSPTDNDGWLLIPGDHPLLTPQTLTQLVTSWQDEPTSITVPTHNGRRGHPTIFPWSLASHVTELPANVGVNQLLKDGTTEIREVPVNDPMIHLDLDTPEDYECALQRFGS